MKSKYNWIVVLLLIVTVAGVSGTLAWLLAKSQPVTNTFTAGNIEIELTETTGTSYHLLPAAEMKKDPKVTVKSGSEPCWLFIEIVKEGNVDDFITYEIITEGQGWTLLTGGVYYRQVGATVQDKTFPILKDNKVTVKDTVTEEALAALTASPKVDFKAYAIQSEGISSAQEAWAKVQP
jgi:hypothetical protein